MRSRFLLASILALTWVPGCASLGTIQGTLRLPAAPGRALPDSAGRDPMAHAPISEAVVYLERPPIGTWWGPPPPNRVPMRLTERRFAPRVLVVVPGTTVRFVNRDDLYHNLFSIAPSRSFETGPVGPGEERRVRFDRPGAVPVFDELDANVAGYVFVVPHACFTRPASDGSFLLPPLPRGDYTLRVWHPTAGTTSLRVRLNKSRAAVSLRLRTTPPSQAAPGASPARPRAGGGP